MRKLTFTVLAAAAILLVNSVGWTASAATSTGAAIPSAARNFSPIKETACRGYGRWCGPGYGAVLASRRSFLGVQVRA